MANELCELWWMFTIKGLVSIVFALTCYLFSSFVALHFLQPFGFLYLLVVFAFYVCLIGVILLVGAIYAFDEKLKHRWLLLVNAVLNLVLGPAFLITFGFGLRFSTVVVLFGSHAIITGVCHCATALDGGGRKKSYLLGLAGIWSVICGIGLILGRHLHEEKVTVDAAIYTAILGLLLVSFSVRLRRTGRKLNAALSPAG